MKTRILLLAAVVFAAIIPSYAATVANCTALGTVTLDMLLVGGADAAGCEISDKIFSGFTYSGSDTPVNITVSFNSNGAIPNGATIQFGDSDPSLLTNVVLTFITSVDTSICPQCVIVNTLDQIFTPPTPNQVAGSFTHSPGGTILVNGLTPAGLSGQVTIPFVTTVSTTFTQTGTGNQLQKISSSFTETNVPEPTTFALLGGGLLGLALLRRKLT